MMMTGGGAVGLGAGAGVAAGRVVGAVFRVVVDGAAGAGA